MKNKVLYAKYNRERLPKYQLATIHFENNDGTKFVKKKPLTSVAENHIKQIHDNSILLQKEYKGIQILKGELKENHLEYPFLNLTTWDQLLLSAVQNKDVSLFNKYLDQYYLLLKGLQKNQKENFEADEAFQKVFGEHLFIEDEDYLQPANIDLIFENIFINENNQNTLIDCEWVFPFKIPLKFILYRSIYAFWLKYKIQLKSFLEFESIINYVGISSELASIFNIMEEKHFQIYVCGEINKNDVISKYVKDNISFDHFKNYLAKQNYNFKIYFPTEKGYSEDYSLHESIKSIGGSYTKTFHIDASLIGGDYNWRIDPIDREAFVSISKIKLYNAKDNTIGEQLIEIDLDKINHNEDIVLHSQSEGFSFLSIGEDPQIFFYYKPDENISKIIFEVELNTELDITPYLKFYSTLLEVDYKQKESVYKQKISGIQNAYSLLGQDKDVLMNENQNLIEENQKLAAKLQKENVKIKELNHTIGVIESSNSWKLTAPLRKITQQFRNLIRK